MKGEQTQHTNRNKGLQAACGLGGFFLSCPRTMPAWQVGG
jgi:hypothetical protein